ncbi:unnamed protein product [Caretta caretta]
MGSEINTMESGTGTMNVSVLSIPQAGPNNTGEFTCGYEENGSKVTYALRVFQALRAHTTQSKNKAKPDEDEHVLYSEVVTTHTWKAAK